MKKFFKRTWAEINLNNLSANALLVKSLIPPKTKIMAVVKADAYGHGDTHVASKLYSCGINTFAVSNLEEAVSIRNVLDKADILVLGPSPLEHIDMLLKCKAIQTVHSLDYAEELNKITSEKISVHIKIDTGMTRLGFSCDDDISELISKLKSYKNLDICGIFSHLSHADNANDIAKSYTLKQIEKFNNILSLFKKSFPNIKSHLQNSAGIIDYRFLCYDYVRPGIMLYGILPSFEMSTPVSLFPVMSLKSCVTTVRDIKKGTSVGYSQKYIAPCDMKIATAPVGYADGYMRALSNKAYALINKKPAKIIGNVCMDQIMINVTHIENISCGDEVTLFGTDGENTVTAGELANLSETIGYEIVCRISKRVQRIYTENGEITDIYDGIL